MGQFGAVKLLMTTTQNPNAPNNFGETPSYWALQGYHILIFLLLKIKALHVLVLKLEHIYNFLKSEGYWDFILLLFSFLILYLLDHLPWYMITYNEKI